MNKEAIRRLPSESVLLLHQFLWTCPCDVYGVDGICLFKKKKTGYCLFLILLFLCHLPNWFIGRLYLMNAAAGILADLNSCFWRRALSFGGMLFWVLTFCFRTTRAPLGTVWKQVRIRRHRRGARCPFHRPCAWFRNGGYCNFNTFVAHRTPLCSYKG